MNVGFTNFNFEEKDTYSKFQLEEQPRMFSYDDARYQGCVEPQMAPSLPEGADYSCASGFSELPPECYPHPSHVIPDVEHSQDESSMSFPQTNVNTSLHESGFFHSFPYQNTYFQHLPHH